MPLIEQTRKAGVVGAGGGGFPAHVKFAGRADIVIGNGAECEPWICCDDALMRERAADVVLGAQVLLHACGAAKCTIAVEDDSAPTVSTPVAPIISANAKNTTALNVFIQSAISRFCAASIPCTRKV